MTKPAFEVDLAAKGLDVEGRSLLWVALSPLFGWTLPIFERLFLLSFVEQRLARSLVREI